MLQINSFSASKYIGLPEAQNLLMTPAPVPEVVPWLQAGRVGTQQVRQADQGRLVLIGGHMCHERQVLD